MARVATIRGCMRTHFPPLLLSFARGTQVENRARIFSFVILTNTRFEKSDSLRRCYVRESLIRDAISVIQQCVIIYVYIQ